ncbi:synaptotagmin-2-like [Anneissia japonica]|uniref:synaptotagmin-2-like n=1 Tax=Anneissia japonica TaxID=1529436 RepID=UPI001425B47E|nr:synaptotagmin-2-like [Anneissia japonica]XP_033096959.1 synaptotagmin-2-like [Anneissia japonica]XP_033096960.1 synaptotagmin-2-like [Anneissia japonica]XP_033096961.1 synaptotagmin-2-like [Anneissia japonica]XP_033096962.1 synaptotagmin-2-like [Anneissia japonica]
MYRITGLQLILLCAVPFVTILITLLFLCLCCDNGKCLKRYRFGKEPQQKKKESITSSLIYVTPKKKKKNDLSLSDINRGLPDTFVIPGTPPAHREVVACQQPPISNPRIMDRQHSMTSKLDPTTFDPSSDMYKPPPEPPRKKSLVEGPSLGILNFELKYSPDMNLLTLRLIEARNLQPQDFSGTADPYCKVTILPNCPKTMQSKVLRKTLNPQFKESFVFEIPEFDIHRQTVKIQLYDFDQFSRDDYIGDVLLPLDNVDLSDKLEVWKEIKKLKEKKMKNMEVPNLGDIMFSLSYLETAERLNIVILKARNLKQVSEKKDPDPYVKVSVFHAGKRLKKKKTTSKHSIVHPVFNEALVFNVSKNFLKYLKLEVSVIHDNRVGQNEVLGKVIVGPDSHGEELAHWNDMITSSKAVARWHRLFP